MYIELTPEQRALQAELRQYFSTLITPDEAAAMESNRHNEAYRAVIKRMGSDGKLGVGGGRRRWRGYDGSGGRCGGARFRRLFGFAWFGIAARDAALPQASQGLHRRPVLALDPASAFRSG